LPTSCSGALEVRVIGACRVSFKVVGPDEVALRDEGGRITLSVAGGDIAVLSSPYTVAVRGGDHQQLGAIAAFFGSDASTRLIARARSLAGRQEGAKRLPDLPAVIGTTRFTAKVVHKGPSKGWSVQLLDYKGNLLASRLVQD
jgi:hypothetical protein